MQGINLSKIGDNVINFFGAMVEKTDKTAGFVKRKSKLTAKLFVETLIMTCFSDPEVSLERICLMLKKRDIKMTKQGLHQRFNDESVELMKMLFEESLIQFKTKKRDVIDLFKWFSSVKITDSTGLSLPANLKNRYRASGGSSSEAGIKLQTTFDYLQGQINEIKITEGRRNDQSFDEHLSQIEKNALYLQDLGYFKLSSFEKIDVNGAYFISRYLFSTKIFDENGQRIILLDELRESGCLFEKKVCLGEKEKIKVRVIATRLSDDEVEKRIRKLKRSKQKRGEIPSKELLEMTKWSIYITNIDENIVNYAQVHLVYSLRWQIELLFKLCKSESGINKISGKNINRILCEIYAKLICVIQLLYFCFPIRWRENENEISFRKAYKALKLKSGEFFNALKSPYRLMKFLKSFFEDLIEFTIKDTKRKKRRATHQKIMDSTQQGAFA